jgi:hypothetical protein
VAVDEALFLETAQPPPARGGGKPHALGKLLVRDAGVRLQFVEDAPIQTVECLGHGLSWLKWQEYCQFLLGTGNNGKLIA